MFAPKMCSLPKRLLEEAGGILLSRLTSWSDSALHRKIEQAAQRIDVRTHNTRVRLHFVLAFPALQQGFDRIPPGKSILFVGFER
jgi:hypothetical protein